MLNVVKQSIKQWVFSSFLKPLFFGFLEKFIEGEKARAAAKKAATKSSSSVGELSLGDGSPKAAASTAHNAAPVVAAEPQHTAALERLNATDARLRLEPATLKETPVAEPTAILPHDPSAALKEVVEGVKAPAEPSLWQQLQAGEHDIAKAEGERREELKLIHANWPWPEGERPTYFTRDKNTGVVTYERWEKDGKLHREGGPAIIKRDFETGEVFHEEWLRNGLHHRDDGGPAITITNLLDRSIGLRDWRTDDAKGPEPSLWRRLQAGERWLGSEEASRPHPTGRIYAPGRDM